MALFCVGGAQLQRRNEQTYAQISEEMAAATRAEAQIQAMLDDFNRVRSALSLGDEVDEETTQKADRRVDNPQAMERLNTMDPSELDKLQASLTEVVSK